MSKLSLQYVGCKFDVTKGKIKVSYKIITQSFSHEYGLHDQFNHEITSVKYYIEEIDRWLELSNDIGNLEKIVINMVEKDL